MTGGALEPAVIERLYLERLPDGRYNVVCNDLATTAVRSNHATPHWMEDIFGVSGAIQVLTDPLMDDLDNEDDVAGVRVGYWIDGMVRVVYGNDVLTIPEFNIGGKYKRLMREVYK